MTELGSCPEQRTLSRTRDLDEDTALIVDDEETGARVGLRVEDFSLDEDGQVWVHGSRLFNKSMLDPAFAQSLPPSFDERTELVESVN